jgi:DNA polymerase-3 subunit alpha
VFELFIFSDTLELNREILKEGSSLILTLNKSISDNENRLKRINVRKVASLKDLFKSPIKEVTFNIKLEKQLSEICDFLNKKGDTIVNINFSNDANSYNFQLKNRRNIDRKSLNLLRNKEINTIIN